MSETVPIPARLEIRRPISETKRKKLDPNRWLVVGRFLKQKGKNATAPSRIEGKWAIHLPREELSQAIWYYSKYSIPLSKKSLHFDLDNCEEEPSTAATLSAREAMEETGREGAIWCERFGFGSC